MVRVASVATEEDDIMSQIASCQLSVCVTANGGCVLGHVTPIGSGASAKSPTPTTKDIGDNNV